MSQWCRQLIAILRWTVDLERLDILLEGSLMYQYQASPWQGNLEAIYCISYYLKHNAAWRIVFGLSMPAEQSATFDGGAN